MERQVEAVQLLTEYAKKKGVTIFMETCKITTTNLVVTSKELKQFIDDVGADNLLGLSDTDRCLRPGSTSTITLTIWAISMALSISVT